jgi:hypothetical protein
MIANQVLESELLSQNSRRTDVKHRGKHVCGEKKTINSLRSPIQPMMVTKKRPTRTISAGQ